MDSNLATVLFPALSPVSSKWLRYQRWPSWLVCSGLWNHLNCYCSLSRWQHWKRSHYTSLTACCTERSEPRQTVQSALAFLSQHGCVVNCSLGYLWATQHLLCVVVLTNCYVGRTKTWTFLLVSVCIALSFLSNTDWRDGFVVSGEFK